MNAVPAAWSLGVTRRRGCHCGSYNQMFHFLKNVLNPHKEPEAGQQQSASYYNKAFAENDDWQLHYTQSPYYFLWTVIVDRLRRLENPRLLEIACGPGQLASAVNDANVASSYVGFDFSETAVGFARKRCPELDFRIEDALETNLFAELEYSAVISTEFLEHIEEDLGVLSRLRQDTYFLGTVPSFPYVSHVRHFDSIAQVTERYAPLFRDFNAVSIPGNDSGKIFYLLEGVKA